MTSLLPDYADWKAPASDSAILIWPSPSQLLADTRENHIRLRDCTAELQNVPLSEVRRRMRQWLGIADDRLALATGHQTELYHSGVWAKLAMIHAAAAPIDAATYLFAVDSDEPKHLNLRWPGVPSRLRMIHA